ncbi:MAG: LacI family DNA-binding transcriptional regulator [Ruminiclostridium sp.]
MRVTISKIAELSNVSRGTVDRVLNDRPGVKDEVRKKVKEIAETLDYKPNLIAKTLVNLKKPIKIGVIIAPDYNPFVSEIKRGIEVAAQELYDYGVNIDVQTMQSLDYNEQISILKRLINDGVSGIAIVPIENDAIRSYLNEIRDNGIPIVTFNSDIKDTKRICFVGQDHLIGGRLAGGLMGKMLSNGAKVAIITSSLNLLCHKQRIEGFKAKITEEHKNIEIVEIVENEDIDSKAFELTLSICKRINNLNGIYLTGGGASGLGKALKVLGIQKQVKVISHDFVPGTIELLKEKIIDFTIGQDPYRQGYLPVKILFDYLMSGKMPEEDFIRTNVDIRTEENIDFT